MVLIYKRSDLFCDDKKNDFLKKGKSNWFLYVQKYGKDFFLFIILKILTWLFLIQKMLMWHLKNVK